MASGRQVDDRDCNAALDEAYAAANEEVQPGQYVMIAVSDTGLGVSRESAARVLEAFHHQEIGRGLSHVYGFFNHPALT
jgi:signal transduction histidine kinase